MTKIRINKYLAKIRKEWIIERWEENDLSMNEIAIIFNCSVSFVFRAIKDMYKGRDKK